MERDSIISEIRRQRPKLEDMGIAHVYLFGSVLRGEATEESDVDLLFDRKKGRFGLIEYARLKRLANEILPFEVDLVERSCLDREIGEQVLPEALRVF